MTILTSTAAAARMLGVSPGTLRQWVETWGFPESRTLNGRRAFDLAQIRALRAALDAHGDVPPAIRETRTTFAVKPDADGSRR